jgi:hypothetical protein
LYFLWISRSIPAMGSTVMAGSPMQLINPPCGLKIGVAGKHSLPHELVAKRDLGHGIF